MGGLKKLKSAINLIIVFVLCAVCGHAQTLTQGDFNFAENDKFKDILAKIDSENLVLLNLSRQLREIQGVEIKKRNLDRAEAIELIADGDYSVFNELSILSNCLELYSLITDALNKRTGFNIIKRGLPSVDLAFEQGLKSVKKGIELIKSDYISDIGYKSIEQIKLLKELYNDLYNNFLK